MPEQGKSLAAWRLELRKNPRSHWLIFYDTLMGTGVSNPIKFYRALNNYGDWAMFEAIIASSDQTLTGDPLPYVLKVCSSKWKEQMQDEEAEEDYNRQIEEAQKATAKQNKALEKKLKKARK
jgi:hypothetical protein